jgi:hypothetical protein
MCWEPYFFLYGDNLPVSGVIKEENDWKLWRTKKARVLESLDPTMSQLWIFQERVNKVSLDFTG